MLSRRCIIIWRSKLIASRTKPRTTIRSSSRPSCCKIFNKSFRHKHRSMYTIFSFNKLCSRRFIPIISPKLIFHRHSFRLNHFRINLQRKRSSSTRSQLPHNNIFCNASQRVFFSIASCL
jgi:hypothetical protein